MTADRKYTYPRCLQSPPSIGDTKSACRPRGSIRRRKNTIRGGSRVKMVRPAPLSEGDPVALISPSFYTSQKKLTSAVRSVEMLGLKPIAFASCSDRYDYLAGCDALRADDLMKAFADPSIRAVFCLRGGYGAARILDLIDYDIIRQNPKVFIGFSDITALHTVINQKCGLITYHGPMPTAPYYSQDEEVTLSFLKRALFCKKGEYEIHLNGLRVLNEETRTKRKIENENDSEPYSDSDEEFGCAGPSNAKAGALMSGRLCGGNLTVLAAALGTPYEIETAGKILFLEDVGERTYRIDRAVTSLRLAGRLEACSGILLGTFEGCAPEPGGRTCEQIITEIAEPLGIPVLSGLPCGHSKQNITLPLGAWCEVMTAPESGGQITQDSRNSAEMTPVKKPKRKGTDTRLRLKLNDL